ncbi:MAG: hypothetical protein IPP29_24550 [Bacteroidetes bacterium]|nr:hypothetical protein [Bacteroidota bacterium]
MQKIETHNGLLYINPIRLNSNQLRLGWNLNFDQNDYLNVNAIASLQEYGLNIDFRNFTFVPNNPNYNELTKGSKFCGGLEINYGHQFAINSNYKIHPSVGLGFKDFGRIGLGIGVGTRVVNDTTEIDIEVARLEITNLEKNPTVGYANFNIDILKQINQHQVGISINYHLGFKKMFSGYYKLFEKTPYESSGT